MSEAPRRNVLYLVRTWAFGGSHTIVLHLMKHLPAERYNITCVPYDAPGDGDASFIREAGRRGLSVAEERIPWRSRSEWARAQRTIADLIEKHDIDLIHTHDPHSNVLVGLGRKKWPCACVASAYGWWNGLFPIRRWINIRIERILALPRFERVITVSNHMKGKVLRGRTPEGRIRVVHTGLDLDALRVHAADRRESRARVRAEFGIPEDACVTGAVSRVSVEKGHVHLLRAAAQIVDAHPALRILIVGDGPARAGLEAMARDLGMANRVIFTGFYDDLPGAHAAMDIFAQPSVLEEGFPTAVLEAELAGLPVIASDIGGTSETMDVPNTGLLVRSGDSAALAEAMLSLLTDPQRRAAMGEAARTFVETSFTLEQMIQQVAATYDEAIETYERQP